MDAPSFVFIFLFDSLSLFKSISYFLRIFPLVVSLKLLLISFWSFKNSNFFCSALFLEIAKSALATSNFEEANNFFFWAELIMFRSPVFFAISKALIDDIRSFSNLFLIEYNAL